MVDQFEECFLVSSVKLNRDFILITQIRKEFKRFFSQRCVNPMIMLLVREVIELSFSDVLNALSNFLRHSSTIIFLPEAKED